MACGSMALWYWVGVSIVGLDPDRRGGEAGVEVALGEGRGRADADGLRREGHAAVEADPGRLGLVGRREQARALGRRLERLGDDERDRLAGVADAVVLQRLDAPAEHRRLGVLVLRQRRAVGRA